MTNKLNIDKIWWRNVQLGEFYNIERHYQLPNGGGSLYIEIPGSMVPATLDFLGEAILPKIIEAHCVGRPGISGPIEFHEKSGDRMRIARQNRQQPRSQRHPAWISAVGFPRAPDNIQSKDEARPYFPEGGLRIYIAKTGEGNYYTSFTQGPRPANMIRSDPMWDLYGNGVGGVIDG